MNYKISAFVSASSSIVDPQCQRKDFQFDHAQREKTKVTNTFKNNQMIFVNVPDYCEAWA